MSNDSEYQSILGDALSSQDTDYGVSDLIADGLLDIPRGVAGGVIGFGQSLGDIVDVAGEAVGLDPIDDYYLKAEARPDWAKTETIFGGLVTGVSQAATAFIPVAGVAGRISAGVRGTSMVARGLASGGLGARALSLATSPGMFGGMFVDAYGFRGDEGHLSDMVQQFGLDNPVTRFFETDENDSWLEGRAKNVLEGAILGIGFDAIVEPLLKAARGNRSELDLLFQDPKRAAEEGKLPPDVVERLTNDKWVEDNFKLDGPARTQFERQLREATGDDNVTAAAMSLTDSYARMYAASKNVSLDEAYSKMFAGVTTDLELSRGDLKQRATVPVMPELLARDVVATPVPGFPKIKVKENDPPVLTAALEAVARRLSQSPTSPEAWADVTNAMFGAPLAPPARWANWVNNDQALVDELKSISPEQYKASNAGFAAIEEVRRGFDAATSSGDKTFGPRLILWNMMSRNAGTWAQEGGYLQVFDSPQLMEAINDALSGNYSVEKHLTWARSVFPEGSPGRTGASVNLNAFVGGFLPKLSARRPDGKTHLEHVSDILMDKNMTAIEKRRRLVMDLPTGNGIGTKIWSFVLLTTGHDVLVLDRHQVRNLWGTDVDPYSSTETAKALDQFLKDERSLALYESLEKHLSSKVTAAYDAAGVGVQGGLGRFHWDTWNFVSGQSVGHESLLTFSPDANVSASGFARQAKQNSPLFGATYHSTNGNAYTLLEIGSSGKRVLSPEEVQEFRTFLNGGRNKKKNPPALPADWIQRGKDNPRIDKDGKKNTGITDAGGDYIRDLFPEFDTKPWYEFLPPDIRQRVEDKLRSLGRDFEEVRGSEDSDGAGSTLLQGGPDRPGEQPGLFGGVSTEARGAVRFLKDGRALVALFKSSDPTTVAHELGHVFRRNLSEISPELQAAADAWVGAKPGERWSRAHEEKWAETFESYLAKGQAPTPELQSVFKKFKQWMLDVYRTMISGPLRREVSPEIRRVFDAMLGSGYNRDNPARPKPINRPPNLPSDFARSVREKYTGKKNQLRYVEVDEPRAKKIADAYDDMKHDPNDPLVRESYQAMIDETMAQYQTMVDSGINIVPWASPGEPYSSSQVMIADVETQKRLYFLKTVMDDEANYGQAGKNETEGHPLLGDAGIVLKDSAGRDYKLTYNDVFRAVHDFFGHATEGYQFGPRGEENAWRAHSQMYSEKARAAMTTETRGQNSWVNAGKHMRRPDGTIPKKGDPDWKELRDRPFAVQKTGILPEFAWKDGAEDPAETVARIAGSYEEALKKNPPLEAGEEAIAHHINHGRLNVDGGTSDVLRAIDVIAQKTIDDDIGAVQSLEEIAKIAEELAKTPADVMAEIRKAGSDTRNLAAKMVAARMVRNVLAKEADVAAVRIDEAINALGVDNVHDDVFTDFIEKATKAEKFSAHVGILQKQVARTITAGRIEVGLDADGVATAVSQGLSVDKARQVVEAAENQAQSEAAELRAALEEVVKGTKKARQQQASKARPEAPKEPKVESGGPSAPKTPTTPNGQAGPGGNAARREKITTDLPQGDGPRGMTQSPPSGGPVAPGEAPVPMITGTRGGEAPQAPDGALQGLVPNYPAYSNVSPQGPGGPRVSSGPSGIAGPGGPLYTPQQRLRIQHIAGNYRMAQRTGQTHRINQQIRKAYRAGVLESLMEVQKASILSGIPTLVLNATSGGFNAFMQPLARTLGELSAGNLKGAKDGFRLLYHTVGSLADMFHYAINAPQGNGPRGLRAMKSIWLDETPSLTGVSGIEHRRAIHSDSYGMTPGTKKAKAVNAFGRMVRLPFALNASMEEFWGQTAYLAHVRMKAMDHVESTIWNNPNILPQFKAAAAAKEADRYVKDAFDNFGRAAGDQAGFVHEDAIEYSKSVNFTTDLVYGYGDSLMKMKNKHPSLDLIIPFIRVPTNLIRTAIRFTPGLGQLQEKYLNKMYAQAGVSRSADAAMRARGEMVIGAAVWGYAAYLAASGQVTGGGPVNKAERDALLATGWRPYSFVNTDENGKTSYTEFRRFDPMATVLGLSADFAEMGAYLEDGQRNDLASAMVMALANNLSSKTYLQGISEAARALTGGQQASSYFRNKVASFVPNALARTASADDDYMREVRSVMDAIKRRVPGYSEDLPPRRDVLGSPMTPPPGYIPFTDTLSPGAAQRFSRMTSPVTMNAQTDDAVRLEMAALAHGFSVPAKKKHGVDLTLLRKADGQDAYDRLQEIASTTRINGRTLHESLSGLIGSKSYQSLRPSEGREDRNNPRILAINRVISAYRRVASQQLYREYPELRQALVAERTRSAPSQSNELLAALNR